MRLNTLLPLIGGVVGARVAGAAAALLAQLILARALLAAEMGAYFFAVSCASLLGIVITAGYQTLGFTTLARYRALRRGTLFDTFVASARRDMVLVAGTLMTFGGLIIYFAPISSEMRLAALIGLAAAPAAAFIRFQSALANATRRFPISFVPDFLVRPVVFLAAVAAFAAASTKLSIAPVLIAYLVLAYVIVALQAWLLHPDGALHQGSAKPGKHVMAWRKRAASLMVVALITIVFADVAVLVASLYLPADQLGIFGICMRLAVLVGFVTQACTQFILPDLADAMVSGDENEVRPALLRSNLVPLSIAALALAGTAVAGETALGLFGAQYVVGAGALTLLIAGQVVRAASAMNAQLLSLGGQQVRSAMACAASLAMFVASAAFLIPRFGLTGAAAAVVVCECAWAITSGVIARRQLTRAGDLLALLWRPTSTRETLAGTAQEQPAR